MNLNKQVIEYDNEFESDTEEVLPEITAPDAVIKEVTDQDGAMKRAIEAVFTKAKHRICMWHIMQKLPSKFKEKWAKLNEDFGLQNHKWMTKMFNLREIWIPAYFIESPLFGLMRTTSRSESENSFFKSFTSPGATLVSFMMSYESAMERQKALDFKTIDAAPKCETKLAIKHHAARVYTRTIFLFVQKEIIEGCWSCTIQDLKINEGCETVIVRDKAANAYRILNAKKGKEQEKEIGTVAETVIDYKIWGKNVTIERLTNEANFLVDDCLFLLSEDEGKMGSFVEKLKILMDEVKADLRNPPSRNT
ncbi:FAR1-related sequence 5-like protein [Tanacetum coccineum]